MGKNTKKKKAKTTKKAKSEANNQNKENIKTLNNEKINTGVKEGINGGPVTRGNPPISTATQFKPGQSGNPAGRAKGTMVSTILKEMLDLNIKVTRNPLTGEKLKTMKVNELIALRMISNAIKSKDLKAIDQYLDRIEGKPQQSHSVNHSGNISNVPDLSHLDQDGLSKLIERADSQGGN